MGSKAESGMTEEERLLYVALTFLRRMSGMVFKSIADSGYSPLMLFENGGSIEGAPPVYDRAELDAAIRRARKELEFTARHNIRVLCIGEDAYPRLLAESSNPPVVLYCLGNTDLNPRRGVSVVGTRKASGRGVEFCKDLCDTLAQVDPETLVVSGLAYGIDAAAHTGAIDVGLPTGAVLAHGLDMLYPAAHRGLATAMLSRGGCLLTEYPSGTRPHRSNFLERNRIVATMTHGVVLVESPEKGGGMSTATTAFVENREVMAVPGRPEDEVSRGCNLLIKMHKANLVETPGDVMECLGWQKPGKGKKVVQERLFPELDGDVRVIYEYLLTQDIAVSADMISLQTGLPIVAVATQLSDMEFDGLVRREPGNRYVPVR